VIGCQRTLRKTFSGKNHQPYFIVLPSIYKFGSHFFCSFQPIGFQILRQHRSRNIQSQNDIYSLRFRFFPTAYRLRTCNYDNNERDSDHAQSKRQMTHIHPQIFFHPFKRLSRYQLKGSLHLRQTNDIPYDKRYKDQQQIQIVGMYKRHNCSFLLLSSPSSSFSLGRGSGSRV
jgi:hypothetical protein